MAGRILIVAGEASGDAQAARLVSAMLELDQDLEIFGAGGPAMREAGVSVDVDISELSLMGISELFGGFRRLYEHYRSLRDRLRGSDPPDMVILIDFPDFNLRLAKVAKKAGVTVFYYVSPQVWAWRRYRMRAISRRVDRMVVLFPFEADLYRAHGLDVHYVGHPLAEEVRASLPAVKVRDKYGLDQDRPLLSLLPGSRNKEVEAMLPRMLEAARIVGERASFAVASAPGLDPAYAERMVAEAGLNIPVLSDDTYNLVAASDAACVSSGTVTVECALLGCPMVVVYRMSKFSYAIARMLVKVDFIAMPNIICGEEIVPELIQEQASPSRIAEELLRYLDSAEYRSRTASRLSRVHDALVQPGAAWRAAELALELLP